LISILIPILILITHLILCHFYSLFWLLYDSIKLCVGPGTGWLTRECWRELHCSLATLSLMAQIPTWLIFLSSHNWTSKARAKAYKREVSSSFWLVSTAECATFDGIIPQAGALRVFSPFPLIDVQSFPRNTPRYIEISMPPWRLEYRGWSQCVPNLQSCAQEHALLFVSSGRLTANPRVSRPVLQEKFDKRDQKKHR
jgi:hypothetical protein